MILVYHNVSDESSGPWCVDAGNFERQMNELKEYKFVYLDNYRTENPKHVAVTFDDGYLNTLRYAVPILKKYSIPFEVFIIGDYVGKYDTWRESKFREKICGLADLKKITKSGGRLQWHTASHPNLSRMTKTKDIEKEMIIPDDFLKLDKSGFRWLAYPGGIYNDRVVNEARKHFNGAVSCTDGNSNDQFLLRRLSVRNLTSFKNASPEVNFLINRLEVEIEQNRAFIKDNYAEMTRIKASPEWRMVPKFNDFLRPLQKLQSIFKKTV